MAAPILVTMVTSAAAAGTLIAAWRLKYLSAAAAAAAAAAARAGKNGKVQKVVLLLGPPGIDTGTHARMLEQCTNFANLSTTGNMLQEAVAQGTELGLAAKKVTDKGGLVSDEMIVGIIKERIAAPDCSEGFILDGFPGTAKQAEILDKMLIQTGDRVDALIEFNIPEKILEERVCGLWLHKASGRSYHVKFRPPRSLQGQSPSAETMKDDVTGESLVQRPDDTLEALRKRLEAYHAQTEPILSRYEAVRHTINANQAIDKVWREIEKLERLATKFSAVEELKVPSLQTSLLKLIGLA
eukprot:CAMPEP_0197635322 /NCGR_PEP_ID=MMETSP1338-20131121/11166_1 /TAXON_ID=43686 ORGANISM="Pelagodinium beii, Strain RCC1491" /NCGR_SAMPLE_ID=MMETSP1338 /ASSEMBLY_ACC=CAM_ASM_000754 /LENGTH=297 /DNA_ID=CAMNT_0043207343 /DNA_START=8 /DNA_END=901 /DNA_ORIENTATION=+